MILLPDNPSIHSVSQFNLMVRLSGSAPMRVRDALFVTDQLVRHGCYDLASRVIDRLAGAGHRNETLNVRLDGLAMAAERVRDVLGLDAMLADSSKIERLLSFNSCIFGSMTTPKRLAIVYSTAWNNFDVSFPFLHCLIASHADCIIYVKNPERGMY